jgi:hypothetical protein
MRFYVLPLIWVNIFNIITKYNDKTGLHGLSLFIN